MSRWAVCTWFAIAAVLAALSGAFGGAARAAGEPDWDGDGAIADDCRPLDSAVHPAAPDPPDLAFEDSDCDGIDGVRTAAYFVAPAGADGNVGTSNAPFQTIQRAIDEARTTATKSIYVATGIYTQRLSLGADADGIRIHGGYEAGTWQRTTSTITTVNGQPEAMLLDGAVDVVVQLATFDGTRGDDQKTAYAIRAINGSEIALIRARATAGPGGGGATGAPGATPPKAANGAGGTSGPTDCNVPGDGGFGFQAGNGTNGGEGGAGGQETNDGEDGAPGIMGVGSGGGSPGAGGVDIAGDSHGPNDGMHGQTGGQGANGGNAGNGGGGANDFGAATSTWAGRNGAQGLNGGVGSGGGGGGGGAGRGGAFDWGAGAGGGQGGDGGAGGTGGFGGESGGGSFGLYLHNSQGAVVASSSLQAGAGGAGGDGGPGSSSGSGGDGGPGAAARTNCGITLGNGGNGGPGGPGGQGGNGGGGSGGPSVAVMRVGASLATARSSTLENQGGGAGGSGGGGTGQSGQLVPAGSPVTDFDGDGITDSSDECAEIPRGTDANGDGCPDRAAALSDQDGDGVPNDGRDECPDDAATTDADYDGCTDATVTPTPTPTPTSTATPTPTPTPTPPPPPPSREIVNASFSSAYKAFAKYTIYKRLVIKGVPRGAKVAVTCKGKKCPTKRFDSQRSGDVRLARFVKKRLAAGMTLRIQVTKAGAIGKLFVVKIRKGKAPKLTISQIT